MQNKFLSLEEFVALMRERVSLFEARFKRLTVLDADNWPATATATDWDDAFAITLEGTDAEFEEEFTPEAAKERSRWKLIESHHKQLRG